MVRPAPEKYLLGEELVRHQTHKHYIVVVRPALTAGGALLLESILFGITGSNIVTFLGLLSVLFLFVRLAWRIGEWRVEAVYISEWRVFEVSGLVTQKVAALPLRKITDLTYEITALGRLLGYGRFILETAGQDQALSSINYVPNPRDMYEVLSHLSLHGSLPTSDPTASGPVPSSWSTDDDGD